MRLQAAFLMIVLPVVVLLATVHMDAAGRLAFGVWFAGWLGLVLLAVYGVLPRGR